MKKQMVVILTVITAVLLSLFVPEIVPKVQADSLIVSDDGAILLAVDQPVLAAATSRVATKDQKPESKKESPAPKLIPITPANKPATVTVHSASDTHLTVTVTETPKNPPVTPASTQPTVPVKGGSPTGEGEIVVTTKQVDKVVVQGKDTQGNPTEIMSIAPAPGKQLVIQNQGVTAITSAPASAPIDFRIDAVSHVVRATAPSGEVNLILPKMVLQDLASERLAPTASLTQGAQPATSISLAAKGNDVVYTVIQQRKLFDTIPLPPSVITVSNATGKSLVPLYARLFGLMFFY